jgi:hypothetical protein
MNDEAHKILHDSVVDRVEKLEESLEGVLRPEEGTLAKMRQGINTDIEKVESKLNWLIIFIMTTVVGALSSIALSHLGGK